MNLGWLKIKSAWQPFTFRGVAAFADASAKRLLLLQVVVALLAAAIFIWFLERSWLPAIDEAVLKLPTAGEVRNGTLIWGDDSPKLLSEKRSLAIIVDLDHTGRIRVPAHVQVEAGQKNLRLVSLFGFYDWPYPVRNEAAPVTRAALEPRWGAWRPPLLWMAFGGVVLGLFAAWWALSTAYFLPLWFFGFLGNRQLTLFGAWRLAGAALMPGALLMVGGMLLYGLGVVGLLELLALQILHWLLGLAYCCGGLLVRPRAFSEVAVKNPFDSGDVSHGGNASGASSDNPFTN